MTCQNARGLLDLFREGRLSTARAGEIKEHLNSCAACAALVEPPPKPDALKAPTSLKQRLMKSLTAEGAEGTASAVAAGSDMRALPLATLTLVVAWVGLMWLAHAATVAWPAQQGDAAGQAFTVRRLP